ncbi:hypothetical protein LshimejAT787_2500300 [Lyophyllum shimeji]|uniref:Uncharacterized protein n=1 Tax=Lyophyllum shimeji TaxID=47721 RepID=A0A9P3UUH8_LYOSH|nr:hypothetical protein LshimejAT787_2500300 [Lyophyllum shimeji]
MQSRPSSVPDLELRAFCLPPIPDPSSLCYGTLALCRPPSTSLSLGLALPRAAVLSDRRSFEPLSPQTDAPSSRRPLGQALLRAAVPSDRRSLKSPSH